MREGIQREIVQQVWPNISPVLTMEHDWRITGRSRTPVMGPEMRFDSAIPTTVSRKAERLAVQGNPLCTLRWGHPGVVSKVSSRRPPGCSNF